MSDNGFENYWSLEGARYSTGDHKERARHAWEAALKTASVTQMAKGFWLDALDQADPITADVTATLASGTEVRITDCRAKVEDEK